MPDKRIYFLAGLLLTGFTSMALGLGWFGLARTRRETATAGARARVSTQA